MKSTNGKGRRKFNYIPPDEMNADEQRRMDTDEEEQFEEEDYEGIAAGSSNEEEATDEEEMEDEAEEDEEGDLVEDEMEEDEGEEDDEEGGEEESDDDDSSDRYEEDIEDEKTVKERRKKLPKSALDDQFFNLAEMNAFLDAQDKVEGERERTGRNLGQFDRAEEVDAIIRAYEEENLQSRNWALQGEAVADERRKDELLEQFMEVDYRTKLAPTITEEKTAQLEAIIKKRIKEKLFDDVVRKFRENEALVPVYRNQTDIEQTVRKSLAEVYEEKFVNQMRDGEEQGTSQSKAELDPAVASIKKDMDSLFLRLDALSHFQFRPQPIREEIKIVNNMPALHMEEVGPTATTQPDVNLLAPEEVMRRVKRAPKASEERDEGDRKRDRRHKKRKQHKLASLGAMGGNAKLDEGEANQKRDQKRKKTLKRGKKMDFAGEMQTLISSEMGGSGRRSAKRARV